MEEMQKVLPKPVDWDELYPGRFIKAADLKGKNVTLKIASVSIEELIGDKGPKIKGIIAFEKTDKHLALNRTNGICLKAMFGKKVQEWVGHRVTLFPSEWNGEDCIRIYGSPDIAADMVASIALPRRRPYDMTMHKVPEVGARRAAAEAQKKPPAGSELKWADVPAAQRAIRSCESVQALEQLFGSIVDEYRTTNRALPVEIDAAHNETIEQLEEPNL